MDKIGGSSSTDEQIPISLSEPPGYQPSQSNSLSNSQSSQSGSLPNSQQAQSDSHENWVLENFQTSSDFLVPTDPNVIYILQSNAYSDESLDGLLQSWNLSHLKENLDGKNPNMHPKLFILLLNFLFIEFGIDFEAFTYLTFDQIERIIGTDKKNFGTIVKLDRKLQDWRHFSLNDAKKHFV